MPQHPAQVRFEDRRRFFELSARPVRCCSSLTAFSVCRMLSAAESTWLLRKSGSWRLTAISASAWILPSMRSSSIGDELGVLLRARRSCRAAARHRDAVLQRAHDALVAGRLRRVEALAQLREARRDLLLVHRLQEPIERRLRHSSRRTATAADPGPASGSPRRCAGVIAGRAADAGGNAAHLEAARVQPLEARARRRPAARRASTRATAAAVRAAASGAAALPRGVHLGVDRRAEARHRDEPGEVRQLARGNQRQQDLGHRRQRGGRGAAREQQQVPPEEKRFLEIVAHAGALRRGGHRVIARGIQSSPAPRGRGQAVHHVADFDRRFDERRLAQHLLRRPVRRRHVISRMIVPGADENM